MLFKSITEAILNEETLEKIIKKEETEIHVLLVQNLGR
jgi:hypothetical protein